jgi:signal transduction histidine kinase
MGMVAYGQQSAPLVTLKQFSQWPPTDRYKDLPVKARGTITYYDPGWQTIFIQTEADGIFVEREQSLIQSGQELQAGEEIEADGVTSAGLVRWNIKARQIQRLGPGTMPAPMVLSGRNAFVDEVSGRRVRVKGWVSGVSSLGERHTLDLMVYAGKTITGVIPGLDLAMAQSYRWSQVEAVGVFAIRVTADGKKSGDHLLFLLSTNDVRVLSRLAESSVGDLHAAMSRWSGREPVRVRGVLDVVEGRDRVRLRDATGTIAAQITTTGYLTPGKTVEVFGFPFGQGASLMLTNAVGAAEEGGGLSAKPLEPQQADVSLPTLTKAIQIRDLSPQNAAKGYPVKLRGVMTYVANGIAQFMQDDSAGIYLDPWPSVGIPIPPVGHRVEVEGFSGPGNYAPVVHLKQIRDLGAAAFPLPRAVTFETLMTGREDSQWVLLTGVVREVQVQSNGVEMVLSTSLGSVRALVPESAGQPPGLVDAGVEIRGVSRTVFNASRRLQSVELLVPNWSQMAVKEPAPADAFTLPFQPVNELFEFHTGNSGLHRTRIRGQVLLRQSDGSFFLQDSSAGIQAKLREADARVTPGTALEVVGFPGVSDRLPILQGAQIRPLLGGEAIGARTLTNESLMDETWHATLVSLEGMVLSHSQNEVEQRLGLQFGSWVIEAVLARSPSGPGLRPIPPGSRVRLAGVCLVRLDENRRVQSFQVLLREAGDVVVVERPSWWTAEHTTWVFGGLGGVLLLVLAWVGLLRRQVEQRTYELREEIEERKRMEVKVKQAHQQLLETSRQAGMAEVATSVLHNVGNVLNSVNVSANLVADMVRQSKSANLARAVDLLKENSANLGEFITTHQRGQHLPAYLEQLSQQLGREQAAVLKELGALGQNVEHIKEIVAMQQNYARVMGVAEQVHPADLVEDALSLNAGSLERHQVRVVRELDRKAPAISVEKHKVLQILVNLIRNAKCACEEAGREDKTITVRVQTVTDGVRIEVADNGAGIAPENMSRLFHHGFTTRKNGHGFGLHNGALAAKELGGRLQAQSEGAGRGACFSLDLPWQPPAGKNE